MAHQQGAERPQPVQRLVGHRSLSAITLNESPPTPLNHLNIADRHAEMSAFCPMESA
jgi:hypothetical protein